MPQQSRHFRHARRTPAVGGHHSAADTRPLPVLRQARQAKPFVPCRPAVHFQLSGQLACLSCQHGVAHCSALHFLPLGSISLDKIAQPQQNLPADYHHPVHVHLHGNTRAGSRVDYGHHTAAHAGVTQNMAIPATYCQHSRRYRGCLCHDCVHHQRHHHCHKHSGRGTSDGKPVRIFQT